MLISQMSDASAASLVLLSALFSSPVRHCVQQWFVRIWWSFLLAMYLHIEKKQTTFWDPSTVWRFPAIVLQLHIVLATTQLPMDCD